MTKKPVLGKVTPHETHHDFMAALDDVVRSFQKELRATEMIAMLSSYIGFMSGYAPPDILTDQMVVEMVTQNLTLARQKAQEKKPWLDT